MPFQFDPEIGAGIQAIMSGQELPTHAVGDWKARREFLSAFFGAMAPPSNKPKDVTVKEFTVKSSDGAEIPLRWYEKEGAEKSGSAVMYIHGGGMIALTALIYEAIVGNYVSMSGVPFLSVDYRLAPENPAPTPVEDAYAALKWLHEHAKELGVDPKKIAVMGDSAGGGIAASVTHLAKERGGPGIAKQILIYPMLDDRNVSLDPHIGPFAMWSHEDNITGWDALLSDRRGTDRVKPTDAAARMTDATGLPPLYIDTGDMDIFRNEILEYATKFGKAGVHAEIHVYPGATHGFELSGPTSTITQQAFGHRLRAIATIVPLE